MKIFIKVISGPSIEINVEPWETIEAIKMKIHYIKGIPPERQIISFEGKRLENYKTLADYNIKKGKTLNLSLHFANFSTIYLELETGEKIKIENFCPCCCNVKFIKDIIFQKTKIQIAKYELCFDGIIGEDEQSLGSLGIKGDEIVKITKTKNFVKVSPIFIEINKNLRLRIIDCSTVKNIKEKLLALQGIPIYEQILFFGEKELEDKDDLFSLGIKKNDILRLVRIKDI